MQIVTICFKTAAAGPPNKTPAKLGDIDEPKVDPDAALKKAVKAFDTNIDAREKAGDDSETFQGPAATHRPNSYGSLKYWMGFAALKIKRGWEFHQTRHHMDRQVFLMRLEIEDAVEASP